MTEFGTFGASETEDGDISAQADHLGELKAKLDAQAKIHYSIPCIVSEHGEWRYGTLTSQKDRIPGGMPEYRISLEGKKYCYKSASSYKPILRQTESNRQRIAQIESLEDKIRGLQKEIKDIECTFEAWSDEDIAKEAIK